MTERPPGTDTAAAGGPLHEVRLLNLPVRLLQDGRDRHDSLLRECTLLSFEQTSGREQAPGLLDLTARLRAHDDADQQHPYQLLEDALAQGRDSIDAVLDLPATVVETEARLEELLAAADRLCRTGTLLTLPRGPAQLRFSAWYLDELRQQVAGEPPRPWDGPLDL